jgi:uncharacterized protein YyaL (SSP411 family)
MRGILMINNKFYTITLLFFLLVNYSYSFAQALPYSPDISSALADKMLKAFKAKGEDYQARTEHFCEAKQPCYINRLIFADSPYLLQHAHNPINWFAWGEEALQKAKKENKPIFLSIGYATCHWCHRMEKESFDNPDIANFINQHFIAIKVDRESRPDIDEFYGMAVQYFQGQQGWPMSLFLTPNAEPFFGGGYYSFAEFSKLLKAQQSDWQNKRQDLIAQAQQLIGDLQQQSQTSQQSTKLDDKLRRRAIKDLLGFADGYHGGFGESQKFPRETWLFLLLDDSYRYDYTQFNDAFTALSTSLDYMARGGIYDQLGGGFHRYSTDPYWKIPHFEKMLYNQALLTQLYVAAHQITPNKNYLRVARQTLDFVLTEMQSPQGGFYSALDADTEGEEGKYYQWTLGDFTQVLDKYTIDNKQNLKTPMATQIFDVEEYGEVQEDNILYLSQSLEGFAQDFKIPEPEFYSYVDKLRQVLLQARNMRVKPHRDEKIIMSWNAMMIVALTQASQPLKQPEYLQAAIKAADFIWQQMAHENQQSWYRVTVNNKHSKPAQLKDYAFYLQALITLYDRTQDRLWLQRAQTLVDVMLKQLWDTKQGGFFKTPIDNNAPLPIRNKAAFDKILPSGNAIAAQMLLRLERRTGQAKYKDYAKTILSAFAGDAQQTPSAFSSLHITAHELRDGEHQLPVYAGNGKLIINASLKKEPQDSYQLMIDINIKKQWHINSHQPLEDNLIPSKIELSDNSQWQFKKIHYTVHESFKLDFSDKPLALYQGNVKIMAIIEKRSDSQDSKNSASLKILNPVIKLSLQACSNDICLLPESLYLYPEISIE